MNTSKALLGENDAKKVDFPDIYFKKTLFFNEIVSACIANRTEVSNKIFCMCFEGIEHIWDQFLWASSFGATG